MAIPSIVIDTNVFVSALRSRLGTSNQFLQLVGTDRFDLHLSVPIVLEYEEVLLRQVPHLPFTAEDIHTLLDYLCASARHHEIFFLWRPTLRDPDDEMLLELAVTGQCSHIITHNIRDFTGAEQFGVEVVTPRLFLRLIGVSS